MIYWKSMLGKAFEKDKNLKIRRMQDLGYRYPPGGASIVPNTLRPRNSSRTWQPASTGSCKYMTVRYSILYCLKGLFNFFTLGFHGTVSSPEIQVKFILSL